MHFKLIRNATSVIEYAGKRLLIDPMLAEPGAYPAFAGTPNSQLRNPLVALPEPVEKLLDVDAVIVTHTHTDHWDAVAAQRLPKDTLIFVQHNADADVLHQAGFHHLHLLTQVSTFAGIRLIKTPGQHGSDEALSHPTLGSRLGEVCGVVMQHPSEQTLYLAGDTIWNQQVAATLARYMPDVIVLNCGEATFIEQPMPAVTQDMRINQLLGHLRLNLSQPHSLDALASHVKMSRRTFTRHFQKATGMSVSAWLMAERLQQSQALLESTHCSVEAIAEMSGFQSVVTFRQHFKRRFNVSPRVWRKSFRGA